jgi:hypothetical protein
MPNADGRSSSKVDDHSSDPVRTDSERSAERWFPSFPGMRPE